MLRAKRDGVLHAAAGTSMTRTPLAEVCRFDKSRAAGLAASESAPRWSTLLLADDPMLAPERQSPGALSARSRSAQGRRTCCQLSSGVAEVLWADVVPSS